MNKLQLLKTIAPLDPNAMDKDLVVNKLVDTSFRTIVELKMKDRAVLCRYKASEPITVYCISGSGIFKAGADLEESINLEQGSLITLEADLDHEVYAGRTLHLLVTKFKDR